MLTPCRLWPHRIDPHGYGRVTVGSRTDGTRQSSALAHRVAYEREVGPIPAGLTIDHLCRNRACVNVDHMEVVSSAENTRRGISFAAVNGSKARCIHGHPFDEANTYLRPNGKGRDCRVCGRDRVRRYQKRVAA